jgi:hypothetical protein
MKYILFTISLALIFTSCKKSDGNSAPQIKFKKITSPFDNDNTLELPLLTISVKDADGDFGFKDGSDTSYIYVKNVSYSPFTIDSFKFPSNIANANIINNWVEAEVNLKIRTPGNLSVITGSTRPRPKTDTLYFEVYMKDFKKNKSNVLRTDDPMLLLFR